MEATTTSLYASVTPQFTRELLSPGLRVGYTDEGGVWQFLAPSLSQRLPLRAIEWRNLVGVTKRIDQLPLHFVEISVQKIKKELPLTCIYLVKCEDLDSYKSVVRPPLAAWADAMIAAKVEWLVLYVPLGTRCKAAGNMPNPVYRKIYDRLRADFSHRKSGPFGPVSGITSSVLQERVCKIDTLEGTSVLGQQQQHESQWTELLLRLRHCVMDAFQIKCFQYEEELRVLDAKRGAVGWDFGAFFLAKERLALMYQQMYLQDDAIRHLDELDAIFVNLNETEKRAFQDASKMSFDRHDPIFTQSPLTLDLNEVQQHIASNRASARLISLYCFCRQIRTLYVMGSFPQLLKRANSFIEFFLVELKELAAEGNLDWHQPFLWAVGACMEVSYACELSWSGRDDEWTASSVSVQVAQAIPVEGMSRALGNVLYHARRMLKSFAKSRKVRNDLHMSFSHPANADNAKASTTWYQGLEQVFVASEWRQSETCEHYERCLSEVSHLASMHFSHSGRHRFAVFLGGECAQYHLARGEFESASRLLRSLARQSEEDGWWVIFSACVQSICRSELALGRSTQAVAACFSMLQVAQEEQVGVSKEEMEQLMVVLVASLGSHSDGGKAVDSMGDSENANNEPKINMGELFRPTVAVETTQASGSVLEHGDIRVTLGIANDFPAGVHLEKVRVRFARMLESYTIASACAEYGNDNVVDTESTSKTAHHQSNKTIVVESTTTSAKVAEKICGEHKVDSELLLEESDVLLDERTGVNLVFLHSGVPVGHYICTGIECVLAGSTFPLLPPSALAVASFDIAAKESTVQVSIDGAPLLMPQSLSEVETIAVSIQANDDVVVNGVLEVRVFKRTSNGKLNNCIMQGNEEEELEEDESSDEEECGIQLIEIQQLDVSGSDPAASLGGNQCSRVESHGKLESTSVLSLALPTLARGSSLQYIVSLAVPPVTSISESEDENEDATNVTVRASVRYQRDSMSSSASITTAEIRCSESTFRVLQPLTEVVRLKRVGTRIFIAIALVCNPFVAVVLRDYHLRCPRQGGNVSAPSPVLRVEHDPNTRLRGTNLGPNDRLHLAFTLACSIAFEEVAHDSCCFLELDLKYDTDDTWPKTMTVRVPLAEVEGKRYQIDVLPRGQDKSHSFTGELIEASANEPVTFQIRVQEEASQSNEAALADDTNTLSLCLNESSEHEWILVGKQLERFSLDSCSGSHNDRRREFKTQKRLLATRSGLLRFPAFHLEVNGKKIPAARIYCQQSCRQVIVS